MCFMILREYVFLFLGESEKFILRQNYACGVCNFHSCSNNRRSIYHNRSNPAYYYVYLLVLSSTNYGKLVINNQIACVKNGDVMNLKILMFVSSMTSLFSSG